jgi:hypothetical protein
VNKSISSIQIHNESEYLFKAVQLKYFKTKSPIEYVEKVATKGLQNKNLYHRTSTGIKSLKLSIILK